MSRYDSIVAAFLVVLIVVIVIHPFFDIAYAAVSHGTGHRIQMVDVQKLLGLSTIHQLNPLFAYLHPVVQSTTYTCIPLDLNCTLLC